MGGNALGTKESPRLSAAEYSAVTKDVLSLLRGLLPNLAPQVVQAYGSKPDFGDLDLLVTESSVESSGEWAGVQAMLEASIAQVSMTLNGPVLSFGYPLGAGLDSPVFQVDLISVPDEAYQFAYRYFAFNDLADLIRRVADVRGFSFRQTGLWYDVRVSPTESRPVCVTRDFDRALEFLGFDSASHRKGFDTLEEVFQFVARSEYFTPSLYDLSVLSHKWRTRAESRTTHRRFQEWLEQVKPPPQHQHTGKAVDRLAQGDEQFPGFAQARAEVQQAYVSRQEQLRKRKKLFNGALLSAWTGVRGEALGALLERFKLSFPSEDALYDFVEKRGVEAAKARALSLVASEHAPMD